MLKPFTSDELFTYTCEGPKAIVTCGACSVNSLLMSMPLINGGSVVAVQVVAKG